MSNGGSRLAMADFDFELPRELIAQVPLTERDASRLMVVDRQRRRWSHRRFVELPELLSPGDLVVVNDSRVIPARLVGRKATGGRVELLLLYRHEDGCWEALGRPARRLHTGDELRVSGQPASGREDASISIQANLGDGRILVRLDSEIEQRLEAFGKTPLPPYIAERLDDDERYQTIFGRSPGSVAAPTAGLHFSEALTTRLADRGVQLARVTLHVGLGTFRPVTARFADEYRIHAEWCSVDADTARSVELAVREGRRIVAVGTTAARTLETFGQRHERGCFGPFNAMTDLYITPGYRWRIVGAMVTNFHVPRSTLLLMVSAFASRELVLSAYRDAVRERYRFFSFGDAMLLM